MSGDLFLGLYWGARRESAKECAKKLLLCFEETAALSDLFSRWYEPTAQNSADECRELTRMSEDQLELLLQGQRNRRDSDKSVIEELGFTCHAWNGAMAAHSVSMRLLCGAFSQYVTNCFTLTLPETCASLASTSLCVGLLASTVRIWHPDWGGIFSHRSREAKPRKRRVPYVDWIFYTSSSALDRHLLPESASVLPFSGNGLIIATQPWPINPTSESDWSNVRAVEAALGLSSFE
jgi:hypothetical protein